MKKSIYALTVFIFAITFQNLSAQNAKYVQAMEGAIEKLNKANEAEGFLAAANIFERISKAAGGEWLPLYYQSLANMQAASEFMGNKQMEKCINSVEKAQTILKVALEKAPKESELWVLQAFVYQGYIWEDMQTNGAKFTPLIFGAIEKAVALNADNPRAYLIKGQQVFFMPEFYGGGAKAASPVLNQAKQKFESFSPESDLHPSWGKERLNDLLKATEKSN